MRSTYVAVAILIVAIASTAVGCKNKPKPKPQVQECEPLPDFTQYERSDLRSEVMMTVDMFNIAINNKDIAWLKCLIEKIKKLIDALGPEDKSARQNLIKLEAMGYAIIDLVENDEEVYP